ncbi:unnamed protein product [marine sediment metagenome]|uniref:Tyr recombinase domain-containing protein n=1 Tax=marine sediment metagenome TaxID=412755 RepID=X1FYA5_9ZZZZ
MKTQLKTLTPLECSQLLRCLKQPSNGDVPPRVYHRNYTMAVLMLDAGLRVGELIQLRQEQLWYINGPVGSLVIEKDQAKNKNERTVPVTLRVHDAIDKMQRIWWAACYPHSGSTAFYRTNPSNPLTTRQVQRIIKAAGQLSIGREIHPHILRHTFATRLMSKTSMRVVQQLLGHSNLTSTQIYTHPNNTDLQEAIDSLNERS